MNKTHIRRALSAVGKKSRVFIALAAMVALGSQMKTSAQGGRVAKVESRGNTDVAIIYADGSEKALRFYGPKIVRVFQDFSGKNDFRSPSAEPPAEILVKDAMRPVGEIDVHENKYRRIFRISTEAIAIYIDAVDGKMRVHNLIIPESQKNFPVPKHTFWVWGEEKPVLEEVEPATVKDGKAVLTLKARKREYFYGGGVQNGRFSHRGTAINIVNENSWTDGGVCSPAPFYWSTDGYGFMAYTFKPGRYDFGSKEADRVVLSHETDYVDYFIMVDDTPVKLLNDYYQLTGHPVLLPKFGFYEGHLNAYNRDYWKEKDQIPPAPLKGGVGTAPTVFEDGKYYTESQKDNGGIKESLNGELDGNYQFSARAVVDRYKQNDLPLGWVLPNDGYGAGYGQTATLEGNVQNLKEFGDYARQNGVEIGLWTQSDLHPIDTIAPLLQRDIEREIRDAGVRVLKTDVAWVGSGYSFGLNGISEVAELMPKLGNNARPFIISLDGWTGTQRYAGIWSGDQTGGKWEYIRFHIPTFIGAGLAGQPNITSDMDGIFGGLNVPVNVREYQWKTFTPMQLNMDGWGSNAKYPHALGEPATSINRAYLKMKSMLIPYTYSIAREAIDGKPMIRPVFLDEIEPYDYALGKKTQYEYLYGPSFLVAPIYQDTKADSLGNDVRHNIYMPSIDSLPGLPFTGYTNWVDYFTGEQAPNGCVYNSVDTPLWKLPLFVKSGSIIPMTTAHNNPNEIDHGLRIYEVYPTYVGECSFTEYDDDGTTEAYRNGEYVTTKIAQDYTKGVIRVVVEPTEGSFSGFQKDKATIVRIVQPDKVKKIVATIGGKKVKLRKVSTLDKLEASSDGAYYEGYGVDYTRFFTDETLKATAPMRAAKGVSIKLPTTDVTRNKVEVLVTNEIAKHAVNPRNHKLTAPANFGVKEADRKPYSLRLTWDEVEGAESYDILFENIRYCNIKDCDFLFEDLKPETEYSFKVCARAHDEKIGINWATTTATTGADPFEFAVKGITATCTALSEGGLSTSKLFDFDPETQWHTKYGAKAVPFELLIDLHSVNTLDKMQYLPRNYGYNGIFLDGAVAVSLDKEHWTELGTFQWERDAQIKEFDLGGRQARYVKVSVSRAFGAFGSGQDIYIFRQPGTSHYIPGDINADGVLDDNDLTSYMNYTGLRQGDGDFEGYVSSGDINGNGLIDAYDIATAAVGAYPPVALGDQTPEAAKPQGTITLQADKRSYKAGDDVVISVRGADMSDIYAFSLALPYSEQQMQYVGNDGEAASALRNFTRDRLHTNGSKTLYVTFVGVGDTQPVSGDGVLATLRFKAKAAFTPDFKAQDVILVNRQLYFIEH